jgi:hypothetical protein
MPTKFAILCLLISVQPLKSAEPVRDMITDRPDTTESPYTVPAGMFQIEASFFDYSRDSNDGVGASDEWIYGQINFKMGIGTNSDLQVIVNTHTEATESALKSSTRSSGFGDITVRYKQNFWGNDSGITALALMPYVNIPTYTEVSDEAWSGGLIVPLSITLTDRLSLGLMIQGDLVPDSDTSGYDLEWLHSATLGISLTDNLSLYLELVGIAGQDADYQALFDTGLTFAVTENLILDAGVRIGMNRPAPDFGVFTGMSIRF